MILSSRLSCLCWIVAYCAAQDCSWLAEFIARSPLLRKLEIHRSRVDDTRLLMLANAFINHPSLTEICLPYNVLGDDSARILARHIDHTGPRVKLVSGLLSASFRFNNNEHTIRSACWQILHLAFSAIAIILQFICLSTSHNKPKHPLQ